MTMNSDELHALKQLLGCYFHQDWPDESGDDASALQAILQSEPKERVDAGIAELDGLLTAALTEQELRTTLIDQVGCYFEPSSEGLTYKQWLDRVRSTFIGKYPRQRL